jgi:hypothetical protein
MGQAKLDKQKGTFRRDGQQDRQNRSGTKRQAEQDMQNSTGKKRDYPVCIPSLAKTVRQVMNEIRNELSPEDNPMNASTSP